MLKIGITGGIGSGKSTVCEVFKCLGIPVYYSDEEAKKMLDEDPEIKRALIELFGNEVYEPGDKLNRKKVSEKIFNDATALKAMNAIVHPAVRTHFLLWLEQHKTAPYILKEAAILIESGAYRDVDAIITVYAPEALRIERVMKRDKVLADAVQARITKQMPEEEKIKLSDYVIYNDDQQLVLPQVLKLHEAFCNS